ncbi:hypothetical protein B0T25DRAFT_450031 [Lasiosphaeria hispida]|uniref:enoyl-[acyl-carrier-protein] reductase n=1 Tax=Lasiosphaeria hispida TaxID=260671 RepID=A0AAJ0MFF8_9PEZI|nr:hypothetical protein B0T25DRAFT_450031 [Lasiosphaeria hispida]
MAHSLVQDVGSRTSSPCRLISHPIPYLAPRNGPAPGPNDGHDGHVLVRFLAAPVNRVDLMVLGGQYPVEPLFREAGQPVPGFDGVGQVEASTSPRFRAGDLVLPRRLGLGTWRTHAVLPAASLLGLPAGTPPLAAALLRSGAAVAWLLLEGMAAYSAALHPGDWLIVSAGTSVVAQLVAQLAARRGLRAALVIRDRAGDGAEAVKQKLRGLGAAAVLTESELHEAAAGSRLPVRPVLALDSVFGAVGQDLAAALAPGGTFVLVGLLAGPAASITVTTQYLFSRQISFLPFRSSELLKKMSDAGTEELLAKLAGFFIDGTLDIPELHVVDWKQAGPGGVEEALRRAAGAARSAEPGHVKTVWVLS